MSKYKEQIDKMTWSFSRLQSWENCKYGWFLSYIEKREGEQNGWAEAGSLGHSLLEDYALGKLKADQLEYEWLLRYDEEVTSPFANFVINLHEHYKYKVAKYLKIFKGFSGDVQDVELEFLYNLPDGSKFKGFIDLISKKDDELLCVDHKISKKFTRKKLKDKQKQIQMYAPAMKDKYGEYPTKGIFHFFQTGEILKVDITEETISDAMKWATDTIEEIKTSETFPTILSQLKTDKELKDNEMMCKHLCSHRNTCEAKKELYGIT